MKTKNTVRAELYGNGMIRAEVADEVPEVDGSIEELKKRDHICDLDKALAINVDKLIPRFIYSDYDYDFYEITYFDLESWDAFHDEESEDDDYITIKIIAVEK